MNASYVELASDADDSELTKIMEQIGMQGAMHVAFQKRPSYAKSLEVLGENARTLIARERKSRRIVGLGTQVEKLLYVNGSASRCGYLCDLRLQPSIASGFALARGYKALREQQCKHEIPFSLSVILDGNDAALRTLTSPRNSLPSYKSLGFINTPAIFFDGVRRAMPLLGYTFSVGTPEDLPKLAAFYSRELPSKQFAPVVPSNFMDSPQFRGIRPSDFYIAWLDGEIAGAIACWEQREFRQVVVHRYSRILTAARPLYNALCPLLSWRPLPRCGEELKFFYLSLVAVKGNSARLLAALFRFMYNARASGPWDFCVSSFHESDPLCSALSDYRILPTRGKLFWVSFPEQAEGLPHFDDRPIYFEMACA